MSRKSFPREYYIDKQIKIIEDNFNELKFIITKNILIKEMVYFQGKSLLASYTFDFGIIHNNKIIGLFHFIDFPKKEEISYNENINLLRDEYNIYIFNKKSLRYLVVTNGYDLISPYLISCGNNTKFIKNIVHSIDDLAYILNYKKHDFEILINDIRKVSKKYKFGDDFNNLIFKSLNSDMLKFDSNLDLIIGEESAQHSFESALPM